MFVLLGATIPSIINADSASERRGIPCATYLFTRDLAVGFTGEDVRQLQVFLNGNGYYISTTGTGSPGNESAYFDSATQLALISFEQANNISPAIGIFRSASMNKLLLRTSDCGVATVLLDIKIVAATPAPVLVVPKKIVLAPTPTQSPKQTPKQIFSTNLSIDTASGEVKALRIILRHLNYLDPYGIKGTPRDASVETNYFGDSTLAALKQFECDYKLVCSGSAETTGWGTTGPKVRAVLNEEWAKL